MKKTTLLIAFLLGSAAALMAGPARPGTFKHVQKNGTVVSLQLVGDEFFHYTLADGQYTVKQGNDGDYYFATKDNGVFTASDVKFAPISKLNQQQLVIANKSIGLRPNPQPNTNGSLKDMIQQRVQRAITKDNGELEDCLIYGRWGADRNHHMNALVLLVEYQDVKFVTPNAKEAFHKMLNEEGYSDNNGTGSAKDYFEDNSNGKFTIDIDVAGPYTLAQDMAFYGGNDPVTDQDGLPFYMVPEACKLAQDAGDVTDFTKYDNDGDGYIDMIFIIYAGCNEAEGATEDTVWPHKSELNGRPLPSSYQTIYDNKKLNVYACTSERSGKAVDAEDSTMSGIGSFCHEFSHVLGLPDVYDTDYGNNVAFGLSYASIMGSGNYLNDCRTPPAYNILERWLVGWAKPTIIDHSGNYVLEPLYDGNGYLLWANNNKKEFFLFENRNKKANTNFGWDQYLLNGDIFVGLQGGEGMLVYHVDCSSEAKWKTNSLNANHTHECVKMLRAVPSADTESSRDWYFPGRQNCTVISDKTVPALLNWNGERVKYNIENIEFDGEKIYFTTSEVIVTKEVGQYDAVIGWVNSEHVTNYNKWQATLTDGNGNSEMFTTNTPFIHLTDLQPETDYVIDICGLNGATPTEILHNVAFTTNANVRSPMATFNMNSEYQTSDLIRLSLQNLEYTPANVEWYIDGKLSNETYLSLDKGKHQICAIITDTEGNRHYLFRYIYVN